MENRVLRYFLVAAREENITRAAEILHISQPALSRQLMQLEDELGAKLFVRGKRNIALTEEGRYLRQRAQEIVDLTEKTERDFKDGIGTLSGEVSIGMGESAASSLMADYVAEFVKVYPHVRFKYYSNNADFIKEQLEKGLLDIGVLMKPTDLSKYEYVKLPIKDRWGVLLPAKCPLAQRERISPSDLKDKKLFISTRTKPTIVSWLSDFYNEENVLLHYNLLYNAAMLVDKGMGITFTAEGAAMLYKNPNIVFRPLSPEIDISTVFVWKKYQIVSPTVKAFIEFVKNAI